MLIVNNQHVIVPQITDLSLQTNTISSTQTDTIYIELFGDSIICGRNPDVSPPPGGVCNNDYVTARVPTPPAELLKIYLPQYRLHTITRSVGGSSSGNLLNGTDGVNGPWPDNINANIIVINHGLNDARMGVNLTEYRNNLLDLRQSISPEQLVVWQTPTKNFFYNIDPYAEIMRDVAKIYNDSLSDAASIPEWLYKLPDGLHPRQLGYSELVNLSLSNAVNDAIIKFLAKQPSSIYRRNHMEKFHMNNQSVMQLNYVPVSNSWVEVYKRDTYTYRVCSRGVNDLYGRSNAGIYDYNLRPDNNEPIFLSGQGYNLTKILRNTGKVVYNKNFNIIADENLTHTLAEELDRTSHDYIIVITTNGDAKTNRLNLRLVQALERCGASTDIYQSQEIRKNSSYILIGIPGRGINTGFESYSGLNNNDHISYAEILFEISPAGEPVILDIFPPIPQVFDSNTATVINLINPMYNIVANIPPVDGFRVLNAKYTTANTVGIPNEVYNVIGNTIVFTNNVSGIYTVITDTNIDIHTDSLVIPVKNIQNLDNYIYRFHPLRQAPGGPPLNVTERAGSSDTHNTKFISRVGDAYYSEPIVIAQPQHGYVRLSIDRKSFIYTPFPDYFGLDSFSYTLLTQKGQPAPSQCVYIEVVNQ